MEENQLARARAYKLFHTWDNEDLKIYFKTTMTDSELVKTIKIWQMNLSEIVPEYDWGTDEMMELLKTFGCEQIDENAGFKSYYEANLFEIWEYANTWHSDEERAKPQYNNPAAQELFLKVRNRNRETYFDVWEEWEQKQEVLKN